MSTDAAPPSSSPTHFLNPADYEKTMTLSALVTVSGVRQAVGFLYAFAGNQMRGVQATPSRPPFGPYSGSSVYQIVLYANGDGEALTIQFNGGGGTVDLAESMTFLTNEKKGTVTSPFLLTGVAGAAPPSSSPTQFLNPADYEKTMTLSALVTVGGVRQAAGVLNAFADNQMRGI